MAKRRRARGLARVLIIFSMDVASTQGDGGDRCASRARPSCRAELENQRADLDRGAKPMGKRRCPHFLRATQGPNS